MAVSYLAFSSDSYRSNIFSGFSRLQEQQEFVDLTLAAEGHFVKVHKNVIALASPYLKGMIQSASSETPVIFLNNVSHNILTYILEYIYQGEVTVPEDSVESFLQVSMSLHIMGINGQNLSKPNQNTKTNVTSRQNHAFALNAKYIKNKMATKTSHSKSLPVVENGVIHLETAYGNTGNCKVASTMEHHLNNPTDNCYSESYKQSSTSQQQCENPVIPVNASAAESESASNFAALITINSDHNVEVQQFAENIPVSNLDQQSTVDNNVLQGSMPIIENNNYDDENYQRDDNIEIDDGVNKNQNVTGILPMNSITLDKESRDALTLITKFSVSQRGALQIVVSRHIYCSHHVSRQGRKYRWRCLDYRAARCPAYIDSFDNRITLRKGVHNHGFHDGKIFRKYQLGKIYHSRDLAIEAQKLPNLSEADDKDAENALEFSVIPVNMNKM